MTIKLCVKFMVTAIFHVIVLPFFLIYRILTLVVNRDSAFQGFSQAFSLIPGKFGVYWRSAYYSYACSKSGRNVVIGFLTQFSHYDTDIGDGVYIGPQSNIGKCSIGKNCLLGSGVHILSGKNQHNFSDMSIPIKDQGGVFTKIEIGEDCWIGNNSTIMANIGQRCVIAAGSVVIGPVESYSIVAGNPAVIIKSEKIDRSEH